MKNRRLEYLQSQTKFGAARWRHEISRKAKFYNPYKRYKKKEIPGWELIEAPHSISLYETEKPDSNYKKTIDFFTNIGDRFKKQNCLLDFSNTTHIKAAAAIVMYAAIEIAGKGRTGKADVIWSTQSKHVNTIIKSSNLYKAIKGREIKYNLESSRDIPIVSSVGKDQMDEIIDFIQKRIYKDKMDDITEYYYGSAVSETINNVAYHAYPTFADEEKRWWLVCSTFDKELFLTIYDQGTGIPNTVIKKSWFLNTFKNRHPEKYQLLIEECPELEEKSYLGWLPRNIPDEALIALSMKGDISRTEQDKHGQGSKSIMALVNSTEGGKLWVFSNYGLYKIDNPNEPAKLYRLPKKFPGTLLQWNIKIE